MCNDVLRSRRKVFSRPSAFLEVFNDKARVSWGPESKFVAERKLEGRIFAGGGSICERLDDLDTDEAVDMLECFKIECKLNMFAVSSW